MIDEGAAKIILSMAWQSAMAELAQDDDIEVAERVGVSRPTVTRWREGTARPHDAVLPKCLRVVRRYLRAKAARIL